MDSSSPKLDDILRNEEEMLYEFEKDIDGAGGGPPGRKYNSLNDLLLRGSAGAHSTATKAAAGKRPYSNVESKVKYYIASLPPPNSQRRPFKKHTSMPTTLEDATTGNRQQLEQEYSEYRRRSQHQISELEKKVQVALALMTQANNESFKLMDQIVSLERRNLTALVGGGGATDTPEVSHGPPVVTAATPRKKILPHNNNAGRLLMVPGVDDTTGSFIGANQTTMGKQQRVAVMTPVSMTTPHGKRNLSFNSSGDLTRRNGSGTDSGINSSGGGRSGGGAEATDKHEGDEQRVAAEDEEDEEETDLNDVPRTRRELKDKGKRRRVQRFIVRLVCCGGTTEASTTAAADDVWPKISYKKL